MIRNCFHWLYYIIIPFLNLLVSQRTIPTARPKMFIADRVFDFLRFLSATLIKFLNIFISLDSFFTKKVCKKFELKVF